VSARTRIHGIFPPFFLILLLGTTTAGPKLSNLMPSWNRASRIIILGRLFIFIFLFIAQWKATGKMTRKTLGKTLGKTRNSAP
jgi:prepilin signal peptidase PulO-like enzyme (type II secretory pathway)